MSKYFGTNGIRGTLGMLTPELAYKAAYAFAGYINSTFSLDRAPLMLLATDARLTGPLLKKEVIAGLISFGTKIIDLGMISTPTAEFMVRKLKADGLIVITASHNPPEYNGLKMMDCNEVSISKETAELFIEPFMDDIKRTEFDKGLSSFNPERKSSIEKYESAISNHLSAILKVVDKKKTSGKKLLLDCANGMAATIAPLMFKELSCKITTINSHIDGNFPGRLSEPTESNIADLINIMKNGDYDAGIAWDGDGDRVIFIDQKGNFVIGDKVFAIAEILRLREKHGIIVTTVATSRIIEDIAKRYESKVIYTKIGAPYISEEMAKGRAILGGEEVGGVTWPDISLAKDGFLTAAKLVESLSEKKLSDWIKDIPAYYNEKIKVSANSNQKIKIMMLMHDWLVKNKIKFNDIDGIRVDFDDSWVIIRPSGTEDYIRIFAEAKTKKKAKNLLEEYNNLINKFQK